MKLGFLAAAAGLMFAHAAMATPTTVTYDITATGFLYYPSSIGTAPPPPSSFHGVFTFTFNPNDLNEVKSGAVTVQSLSVPYNPNIPVVFTTQIGQFLNIYTNDNGSVRSGTNDFSIGLGFNGFTGINYVDVNSPNAPGGYYEGRNVTLVDITPPAAAAVPEPTGIVLLLGSLAGAIAVKRRGRSKPATA